MSARACVRACVRYLSIFLSISLSLSIHAHIYVVQRANNEQRCWSMCIFTRTHARTHAHTHTHTHTLSLSLSLSNTNTSVCLSIYLFLPPPHTSQQLPAGGSAKHSSPVMRCAGVITLPMRRFVPRRCSVHGFRAICVRWDPLHC